MEECRELLKSTVYFLGNYKKTNKNYDELLKVSRNLFDKLVLIQDKVDNNFYYVCINILKHVNVLLRDEDKYFYDKNSELSNKVHNIDDLILSLQIPVIYLKNVGVSNAITYRRLSDLYDDLRALVLNKPKIQSIKDCMMKRAYAYQISVLVLESILINDIMIDASVKQLIDLLNLIVASPVFDSDISERYKKKADAVLDNVCEITNRKLMYELK